MMDRSKLLELLGPFPARVPLEPQLLERMDCGSYVREKISYCTEPEERISAYVLFQSGRFRGCPLCSVTISIISSSPWARAKSSGYAVIPIRLTLRNSRNRGSSPLLRMQLLSKRGNWSGGTFEAEYYELASRLVRGQTLLAKVLHDAAVGIDYLVTRPDVDPHRIGFLGHSYGGRMAIWLPAIDRRIRAAVSNCGCLSYADSLHHEAGIQMEFCIPGFMKHGEIKDIVAFIAPTPLLISAAIEDPLGRTPGHV